MRMILALFSLVSCVGLPDRAEVSAGRQYGDVTGPRGGEWDDDSGWVAVTLSFPIRYSVERMRAVLPPPEPRLAQSTPVVVAPPPVETKPEAPWWEDFSLVQALLFALFGGAAVGAKPLVKKCRTAIARRKGQADAD